jgi:glycosyltransferase involved in cell wall biosynthesis
VAGTPTVVLNSSLIDGDFDDAMKFCHEVLPTVRARLPRTRFVLASRSPEITSRAAADLVGLEVAPPTTDFRTLCNGQTVAVAPLWAGSDVHSSVLQPMAASLPVVATPRVYEKLLVEAGRDLRTADNPVDFGARVIALLENAALREQVGAHGRAFVEAHFSWAVCTTPLDEILGSLVARTPDPQGSAPATPVSARLGA